MDDPVAKLIRDVKQGPRGRVQEIAQATGIKVKTLRNLRYGATSGPRYDVVRKLSAFYAKATGKRAA